AALIAPFLFLDLTFLAANLLKVFEGGWVPLALGAVVMLLMYTWRRGSKLLFEKSRKLEFPLAELVAMLEKRPPQRVSGTSFFLSRRALKPAAHSGMPRWQDHLFIALSRTANDATDYFQIPSGRVVEVGTQVTV